MLPGDPLGPAAELRRPAQAGQLGEPFVEAQPDLPRSGPGGNAMR
jgi:hypothetical protein